MIEGMNAIGPSECPRVVDAPALAIHRDPGADPFQAVSPGEGRAIPDRSS